MFDMVHEGLIVPQDSEAFFALVNADMDWLDATRLDDFKYVILQVVAFH